VFLAQCYLQQLDDQVNSQKRKSPFSIDKNKHRQDIEWHGTLYTVRDSLCIVRYLIEDDPMAEISPFASPNESGQKRTNMRDLPTGTVTLLFTDIEGSTQLLKQLGEHYHGVLEEYWTLLRASFQANGGHEVDANGDALFYAFSRPSDAISAAVEVQRTLISHSWNHGAVVRVLMGLHTGEPELATEGYVGLDVHHAARIMSAGHGGKSCSHNPHASWSSMNSQPR